MQYETPMQAYQAWRKTMGNNGYTRPVWLNLEPIEKEAWRVAVEFVTNTARDVPNVAEKFYSAYYDAIQRHRGNNRPTWNQLGAARQNAWVMALKEIPRNVDKDTSRRAKNAVAPVRAFGHAAAATPGSG